MLDPCDGPDHFLKYAFMFVIILVFIDNSRTVKLLTVFNWLKSPPPTCGHPEGDGTVGEQVLFERLWDGLSEVVDFNFAWENIDN